MPVRCCWAKEECLWTQAVFLATPVTSTGSYPHRPWKEPNPANATGWVGPEGQAGFVECRRGIMGE